MPQIQDIVQKKDSQNCQDCYVGLDLGGTSIKAGALTKDGIIILETELPTEADHGPEHVVDQLMKAYQSFASHKNLNIKAIGIGSPGMIDFDKGEVINSPNLTGFRHVPLVSMIESRSQRPTYLENDANAAALGEYWLGAAKDKDIQSSVMLTLGTGVGGGIVIDGQIFRGGQGGGGELGHMIIAAGGRSDNCGQIGCLEAYSSATAIREIALEKIQANREKGRETVLDTSRINAKSILDAAKNGDPIATETFQILCDHLGIAVVNCSRIFDPQMVVIAGGVSKAGTFLLEGIQSSYQKLRGRWPDRVQIKLATLGSRAGMVGAAAVALNQ